MMRAKRDAELARWLLITCVDTQGHGRIGVAQPLSHHVNLFAILK